MSNIYADDEYWEPWFVCWEGYVHSSTAYKTRDLGALSYAAYWSTMNVELKDLNFFPVFVCPASAGTNTGHFCGVVPTKSWKHIVGWISSDLSRCTIEPETLR